MDKVIVYGLGKDFNKQKKYLKECFNIVGYCDKQKKEFLDDMGGGI